MRRSYTKVWVVQVSQVSGYLSKLVQRQQATQLVIYEATPGHLGGVCGPVIGEQGGHLCVSSKFLGGVVLCSETLPGTEGGQVLKRVASLRGARHSQHPGQHHLGNLSFPSRSSLKRVKNETHPNAEAQYCI